MIVDVVHPRELGEAEIARWRGLQQEHELLRNPFLSPEFTVHVARRRPAARVAVLRDATGRAGFFPFERRPLGRGVPIAAGLTDAQGIVHAAGLDYDAQGLLHACRLAVWEFDHLVGGQAAFDAHATVRAASPVMDLGRGAEAYLADLATSFVADLRRKRRKLERDVGPLRLELDVARPEDLHGLMAWKSDQYRRTGRSDRFAHPWIVALVRDLLDDRSGPFRGLLSMLYAGDTPIAGHFGLRDHGVLAAWFPAYDTAYRKYSPGLLQHLLMAEAAAADGVVQIDMGRGGKEYKDAFKNRELVVAEGRVVRRVPTAGLHWARRVPSRWLRNTVTDHPWLYRRADAMLKQVGRLQVRAEAGRR